MNKQTVKDIDRAFKALEERGELLDKIRAEIECEVKFWSEPSKYNLESVVNARRAKVQSYKHCLEIIDKYKAESEST